MVEEAKCIAAMQSLEDCQGLCAAGRLSRLSLSPQRLELLQHISVLGGSSKCSQLSIVRFSSCSSAGQAE